MNELPQDPVMLLSVINMKLRDIYASLDALCDDMHIDRNRLVSTLKSAGFEYDATHNRFW